MVANKHRLAWADILGKKFQEFKYEAGLAVQWHVASNSRRVLRRLNTLRGLSHERVEQVLTRVARARGEDGAGVPWRVAVAVGGSRLACAQDLLRAANAVGMGQACGGRYRSARRHHYAEAQLVKDLAREVKELRRANDILKLASAFFAKAEPGR